MIAAAALTCRPYPRAGREPFDEQRSPLFWLLEQQKGADAKTLRNPFDVVDRHVALAALDAAEIGSVHFDLEREILLAQAARAPVAADVRCQNAPEQTRMRTLHAA